MVTMFVRGYMYKQGRETRSLKAEESTRVARRGAPMRSTHIQEGRRVGMGSVGG